MLMPFSICGFHCHQARYRVYLYGRQVRSRSYVDGLLKRPVGSTIYPEWGLAVRPADPIIAIFRDVIHSTSRSMGRSTDESLDQLLEQSLGRLLDGLFERPLDQLLDRLLERPLDRELVFVF